jgi:hypothetical protein
MSYSYAGVRNGDYCGCSNTLGDLTPVDDAQCAKPCVGDKTKMCGNVGVFGVYKSAPLGKAKRRLASAYARRPTTV